MKNTIRLMVVCLIATIVYSLPAKAAVYDPSSDWKTISTPHFRVHHPARIGEIAKEAAKILEEIYPEVTAKWDWKPLGYTEVVLVDNSDDSNGMASVLPYNWLLIYAVPPSPESSLGHYDNWLRMLLIHEFTHIVQIDAYGGIWYPIRMFLGKTVAPSGITPTWVREGIAQFDETIFTDGGRGKGSFSEMMVRTSVLENNFPTIDLADGLSWRWPGYRTAYVYGIKFIQYLVDKYGEDKFMQFDRRVRKSLLLTMINHQAKNVYGKTFYTLWKEWRASLEEKYAADKAKLEGLGLTPYTVIVDSDKDEQFELPTLSKDGKILAYVVTSPHTKTQIRVKDLASGEIDIIRKGQGAGQMSFSPDRTKLIYSAMGTYKKYNRYYDLWLYNFGVGDFKKGLKRLTNGARARDPDFAPDGKTAVFVAGDGATDKLKTINIETKKITTITPDVPRHTQFANPRVSPDGKYIAVSVWKPGDGWRIYRYNVDGTNQVKLVKGSGLVIQDRPAWSKDSRYVVYVSDENGISNLYAVSKDGGDAKQITNVLTGAFQPSIDAENDLYVQYYTSKGYVIVKFDDIFVIPEEKNKAKKGKMIVGEAGHTEDQKGEDAIAGQVVKSSNEYTGELVSKKYVAFGKSLFLPRFVLPNAFYDGDTFFASIFTGGSDVLRWHNWLGGGTYRSGARHFGYDIRYWYNRYKPIFSVNFSDFAVDFGNLTFVTVDATGAIVSTNTVHMYEHRRAVTTGFTIPIQRHAILANYFFEDHMAKTKLTDAEKSVLNLGHYAGLRFAYVYGDAERYQASISPENGRTIRLVTSISDSKLGAAEKNEQVIFSGDWREYIRLVGHHVLALRGAGGMTWGDTLVQGTFGLGGALGEGSFGGGGSYNYFPLRGLPVSAFSKNRAMLFSAEYRFPIYEPLRGIGTVPLFFKDISGALFADYGNAWNAHESGSDSFSKFFDDFLLGVGAELRGNFIVGHGMLVHGRVGYAVIVINRDRLGTLKDPILGDSIKNGMLVLTIGASF